MQTCTTVISLIGFHDVQGLPLCSFLKKFGSDKQKYTSQIWFEEGFGILRCEHF
jgi:hypothetical protein